MRWDALRREAVLVEDDAVLAVNKPAGIAVTGERHETDLVREAAEAGERLFPVHRIDKVTSGVVLLAKELARHGELTRQFHRRTVDKTYLAVVRATGLPQRGTIELPLSVGRKNRVRVAAPREAISYDPEHRRWSVAEADHLAGKKQYPSSTSFARVWEGADHTLLAVRPLTGRRHQIRVHLAWTGHPIEGDPLFDRASAERASRACLHSWRLSFYAPWRQTPRTHLVASPAADFFTPLFTAGGSAPSADVLLEHATRALDTLSPGGRRSRRR